MWDGKLWPGSFKGGRTMISTMISLVQVTEVILPITEDTKSQGQGRIWKGSLSLDLEFGTIWTTKNVVLQHHEPCVVNSVPAYEPRRPYSA